ncbi:MAG: HPr(Ser) kinase/phosphatase [bacterium]
MNLNLKNVKDAMNFDILAGEKGLDNVIEEDMLCRPGMEFAGFYDYYEHKRIILVGSKESSYLNSLDKNVARERVEYLFKQSPPAFLFSKNVEVSDYIIKLGNKYNIPVFKSDLRTTPLSSKLYSYLQELLATRISVHGVLVDINGMGTLITGKSGIGKSETALELIKRGHQLVSDDRIELFEKEVGVVIGSAPKVQEGFMEIRGIGIVNYIQMFGVQGFRDSKKIRLVVELEKWDETKVYDRLGIDTATQKFFETEIPKVVIPVLPGRNVALLVESAAANMKLKYMGYDGANEFIERINHLTKGGK